VTSLSDAQNTTLSFTYGNEYGHAYLTEISAVVGIDNITTRAAYDYHRGWITAIQEPKGPGYEYLYSYDVLGRVTKKEFPLLAGQQERSYVEAIYDDANRMVTIIDKLRHYTTRHYDRLGRLTDIKWYTGEYESGQLYATRNYTFRYDDLVSSVADRGNDTYYLSYDFLGRIIQGIYPDSVIISNSYDDINNKIIFTNGRGYERIYWYDWVSQLVQVDEEYDTDLFATTTYTYDEIGHLLSFTDAENHTTSYGYESFFGLTRTTYPDSKYEMYTYDDAGNVVAFTDCNNNTTSYTYDDIYRLTQIAYADQSTVSYTYDLNSNRIHMDDDAPNTGDYVSYTYDRWNRLVTETRHISQESYAVSYGYDVSNQLAQITYPDSMQILYEYDDLNRMTEIKRYVDGQNDEILFSNPQYDVESLLTQFEYGNGLQAFYTFDSRDRPLTIDVKDGLTPYLDLDYTYDNNSNITQISDRYRNISGSLSSAQIMNYIYDGLDRLIEEKKMGIPVHTYSYDKAGNRTGKDSITYTINAVNEVTALSNGTSFTYDRNGNRIQKTKDEDTWDYTYDYVNRLTKIEKNQSILGEYAYDGDGKRLQKTENNITTTYIYSGINVIYEANPTGWISYIYGPTGLLAKLTTIDQESNMYYYHKDHLGSTRVITDSNKTVIATFTYHPFGEIDNQEGSEESLFTGKEKDFSELYYYGARYYDPDLGRFITRDPLKGKIFFPETLNPYSYCKNNPIKYTDTWGLQWIPDDIDPDKFDILGNPGDSIFWEGQWYILITPIFRVKGSNIGVAIGFRRFLDSNSRHRIYGREEGILIFIYNDNGEIVDILFIPFSKFDTRKGKREAIKEISEILRKYNINIKNFLRALNCLEEIANGKSTLLDKISLPSGALALIIGFIGTFTALFTAGLLAITALVTADTALKWGSWMDIFDDIGDDLGLI
jgi:RHS repeat-associated protein